MVNTPRNIGSIAICAAEGNCTIKGTKTHIYYGHIDPGNKVKNFGFCSDQGEGGGTPKGADKWCTSMLKSKKPDVKEQFRRLNLDPTDYWVGVLNALDLHNQASPRVAYAFPVKYRNELAHGRINWTAITRARVEAFRDKDGVLKAGNLNIGLFYVCANNDYYQRRLSQYKLMREQWRWNCIYLDQSRRVKAIADVINLTI